MRTEKARALTKPESSSPGQPKTLIIQAICEGSAIHTEHSLLHPRADDYLQDQRRAFYKSEALHL